MDELLRAVGLSLPRLIRDYMFLDETDFRFEIVERFQVQDLVEDVRVLCRDGLVILKSALVVRLCRSGCPSGARRSSLILMLDSGSGS